MMSAAASVAGRPLHDLKVLELGHIVAGPTAGQILADLGADVIKIEAVDRGDQARSAPGPNAGLFHFLNRNKRSVALDLKGRGRKVFLKLVAECDVVIDNFAFGAIDKLGIGYPVSSRDNPGLVWLSIKGFLPGPAEGRPMLDELAQMMGGLAFMTGPEGQPMRAGASVIDVGAATYGIIGVLAALRQREATGRGEHIIAGLFETSVYWVGQWMASAQLEGAPATPMPSMRQGPRMGWGVYQLFGTADGDQLFVGITSNAHWHRFCEAFGRTDLLEDRRFDTNERRVEHRDILLPLIAAVFEVMESTEAQARLEEARVPFAPVRRPDQLPDDPHLRAAGQLVDTPLPGGVTARLPKMPISAPGFDMAIRSPAPTLGADTYEVMETLGYSSAEIAELAAAGAIRVCPAEHHPLNRGIGA
jgi:crotonobetainyl-CoA:carnitine CoA-transferase CaiB-like acyl-CoA transferase